MRENIRQALEAAQLLRQMGFVPFVPHLSFFWDLVFPHGDGVNHDGNYWMEYDRDIIERCQAMFRLEGESKGADMETEWAREMQIPVFYRMEDAMEWVNQTNAARDWLKRAALGRVFHDHD